MPLANTGACTGASPAATTPDGECLSAAVAAPDCPATEADALNAITVADQISGTFKVAVAFVVRVVEVNW